MTKITFYDTILDDTFSYISTYVGNGSKVHWVGTNSRSPLCNCNSNRGYTVEIDSDVTCKTCTKAMDDLMNDSRYEVVEDTSTEETSTDVPVQPYNGMSAYTSPATWSSRVKVEDFENRVRSQRVIKLPASSVRDNFTNLMSVGRIYILDKSVINVTEYAEIKSMQPHSNGKWTLLEIDNVEGVLITPNDSDAMIVMF